MRLLTSDRPTEVAPKGKRTVRANVWGNTNGYIGGRFWKTIGQTHSANIDEDVAAFLNGSI